MHNKSFTMDGQVAIVGGRNIGKEYFGASAGVQFRGSRPGGHWAGGHRSVGGLRALLEPPDRRARLQTFAKNDTSEEFAAKREELISHQTAATQSEYADTVRGSKFARQFRDNAVT